VISLAGHTSKGSSNVISLAGRRLERVARTCMQTDAQGWAAEEFGHAALGDARRTTRLVTMAARLAGHAHGRLTAAFAVDAERQGAYRLLENPAVLQESLADAAGEACARRAAAFPFVFVPVDESSLTLTDPLGLKGFGAIGPSTRQARGLHAVSALGVSPKGETLGVLAQRLWMRPPPAPPRRRRRSRRESARRLAARQRACRLRATAQKETQHWIDALHASACRVQEQAPGTRCWFQLDREGDAGAILQALQATGQDWTVRSAWNRRVLRPNGSTRPLREVLLYHGWVSSLWLDVPAGPGRTARQAVLQVHVLEVVLDLRDPRTSRHTPLRVHAVWAEEVGTCPAGETPLDWLLLTNRRVTTFAQAKRVLDGYATRWRIEEAHRTWKRGGCQLEATQLHSEAAVKKWATLLFTVATRIERLKTQARAAPEQPASVELSAYEIRALLLLKRKQKKRTEVVPDTTPSIGQAVRWIADLGGYTGKSSGGPPGSVTIGRGFAKVLDAAELLEALDQERSAKM
jgi:hypothetical protein